jgi:hypothetical protein
VFGKKKLGKSYGFDEKLHLVLVEWPTTCGLDIVHLFETKQPQNAKPSVHTKMI